MNWENITDLEANMNIENRIGGELGVMVLSYAPLVKATAHRYEGRGADFEDLVQEGFMALLVLIPKCKEIKWLPLFLRNRLPGYVRAAAARMRNQTGNGDVCDLECIEEIISDSESTSKIESCELRELLERTLSQEELDITQALIEGFTQKDIAEITGVSQQAVSQKLRKIRNKLKKVIDSTEIN